MRSIKAIGQLTVFFFFLGLTSCYVDTKNESDENDGSDLIIRINPLDSVETLAKKVFDSITYIPLETNSESMFGEVSKMEVVDSLIFVSDRTTSGVYVFHTSGKFKFKVTSKQLEANGRKSNIADFSIDRQKKHLVLINSYQLSVYRFDFDGTRISESAYPFDFVEFGTNGNDFYYYRNYSDEEDSGLESKGGGEGIYKNLIVTRGDTIVARYFPYSPAAISRTDVFSSPHTIFFSGGGSVFFARPYDYHIYRFSGSEIKQKYRLEFPRNFNLPKGFLTKEKFSNERIKFLKSADKKIIVHATNIYAVQDVLAFSIDNNVAHSRTFIFWPESGKYFNVQNILSDSLCYALPFCENRIMASDGTSLYGVVSSKLMFQAYLFVKRYNLIDANPILSAYFREASADFNPVVTVMKPRSFSLANK